MTKTQTLLRKKIDALTDLVTSIEDDHYPTAADRVQALRMIAETADAALPAAVSELRREGATWEVVARWLGVSRQAAHERFGQ